MATTSVSASRPALYYPYIHIRSEHWLKATLLCFPRVFRMIPYAEYAPEDSAQIQQYVQPDKRGARLLDSRGTAAEAALAAQQILLQKLEAHRDFVESTYSRKHAGQQDEGYLIHDAKMDVGLREYLLRHRLAWPAVNPDGVGHRQWLALHHVLGRAIMSTIALAIAQQYGFDIVTDNATTHETLISTDQDQILDGLLGGSIAPSINEATTANELGQLVISMSGVNLKALRPVDIVELKEEKQDFCRFRALLLEKAAELGNIPDATERCERLRPVAEEIVQAWHDYRRALPKRLAQLLFDASKVKVPDVVATALANVTTTAAAGAAAGFAVCLLTYGGMRVYGDYRQRSTSPYRWLSRITAAQDPDTLLACPLGLETASHPTKH
jgi:hypothetical protein